MYHFDVHFYQFYDCKRKIVSILHHRVLIHNKLKKLVFHLFLPNIIQMLSHLRLIKYQCMIILGFSHLILILGLFLVLFQFFFIFSRIFILTSLFTLIYICRCNYIFNFWVSKIVLYSNSNTNFTTHSNISKLWF